MPYNYDVIVIADRDFKGVELLEFINRTLNWTYYIRLVGNTKVIIDKDPDIGKLSHIELSKKYDYSINKLAELSAILLSTLQAIINNQVDNPS